MELEHFIWGEKRVEENLGRVAEVLTAITNKGIKNAF